MRLFVLLALILFSPIAWTADKSCHWLLIAQDSPALQPATQDSYESLMGRSFDNGGFLREFFGPTKNHLPQWIEWLKGGQKGPPPQNTPGIYYSDKGLVVAKKLETPIDFAPSLTGKEDPRVVDVMTLGLDDIKKLAGNSPEANAGRNLFQERLDLHLFGLYGTLNRPSHLPPSYDAYNMQANISNDPGLVASIRPRVPFRVKPTFGIYGSDNIAVRGEPLKDFLKVAEVIKSTDEVVIVRVRLGDRQKPENRNQEVIQQMFFITYWQMVQKAYRESELFPDTTQSSLYLIDNFVKTMKESSDAQDLYFMYDLAAWQSMTFRMSIAHQFAQIHMFGAGWQPYQYQTIADVFHPFYPMFGVTTERYKTGEFELKRLFHNPKPDPLNMLPAYDWPKTLNKLFFNTVAEDLPQDANLVVVSKTKIHNRLYQSMGFSVTKEEHNADWDSTMWTLRHNVRDYLNDPRQKYQEQKNP